MELRGDLPGGRRELRLRVGPFAVVVTEIPGSSLMAAEWRDIEQARRSYVAMWGPRLTAGWSDDPFDGRGAGAATWDARHYLAWVRDLEGEGPPKLLTARKVKPGLDRRRGADPGSLIDLRLWGVRTPAGQVPLWDPLRVVARGLAPDDELAELRIASIGRIATLSPHEQRTARRRERTAVAWAAIQLLAANGDPSLLWMLTVRPDFGQRVFGVRSSGGSEVAAPFPRTERVLGLADGAVGLANQLPLVREHKLAAPGYFVNSGDASRVLAALLDEGRVTMEDLRPALARVIEEESAIGGSGRQLEELLAVGAAPERVAEALTRPRAFKYLIPLLMGQERPSRMSSAELRVRLLYETGDGPLSASGPPWAWAASASALLEVVENRYLGKPAARTTGAATRSRLASRALALA